jgi:CRP-like cAMP-binding protein
MFGEMVLLGQQMYDNYAEAMDEAFTCVMNGADVHRLLLSDPRVAARIVEILGRRLVAMERRLAEEVFFSVPQRVAATLCTLIGDQAKAAPEGPIQIPLTHGQIAALAGTSRETTTKALGELADHGALRLGRGRITVVDPRRLAAHVSTP